MTSKIKIPVRPGGQPVESFQFWFWDDVWEENCEPADVELSFNEELKWERARVISIIIKERRSSRCKLKFLTIGCEAKTTNSESSLLCRPKNIVELLEYSNVWYFVQANKSINIQSQISYFFFLLTKHRSTRRKKGKEACKTAVFKRSLFYFIYLF